MDIPSLVENDTLKSIVRCLIIKQSVFEHQTWCINGHHVFDLLRFSEVIIIELPSTSENEGYGMH